MEPDATSQLMAIRRALREQVAPAVGNDRWAASVLLSIDTMLGHLAARVAIEATLVVDDSADARATLEAIVDHLPDGLARAVRDALATPPIATTLPDLEALTAENRALRGMLDAAIDELPLAALGAVDAYLQRHVGRYAPLTAPFAGRTY